MYTIAVILIVLWLLGLVTSYTIGGLIHILLVLAIISILVRRLRAPEVHAEFAQMLREEFHDIARQARDETRPSGE